MSRPAPLSLPSSSTPRRATSSSRPVPEEDTPPPPTASSLHSRVSSRTARDWEQERERGATTASTDRERDWGRGTTAEGSSREGRHDWGSGSGVGSASGRGRGLPAVKGTIGALGECGVHSVVRFRITVLPYHCPRAWKMSIEVLFGAGSHNTPSRMREPLAKPHAETHAETHADTKRISETSRLPALT